MNTETVVMTRYNINSGRFDSTTVEWGRFGDGTIYVQSRRGTFTGDYGETQRVFNQEIGNLYRQGWR